jgi:hypothetical protein
MINKHVLDSFVDEMEKIANPLSGLASKGGKAWGLIDDAAEKLYRMGMKTPSNKLGLGGQLGTAAARGGIGGAIGAATSEDSRRGAIQGALVGAASPYVLRGVHHTGENVARMLKDPRSTMSRAWATQGGTYSVKPIAGGKYDAAMRSGAQNVKGGYDDAMTAAQQPGALSKMWHGSQEAAVKARTQGVQNKYKHLVDQQGNVIAPGQAFLGSEAGLKNQIPAIFGELSRRGWTGQGRVTKYLPVGGKGISAAFAGMSAPTIYRAATGEGSVSDAAGEIGSNLGFIGAGATGGSSLIAPMASSYLFGEAARRPVAAMENRR